MTEEGALSIKQLTAVLENVPVAIIVSAADSWELLYANPMAMELIGGTDRRSITCYQALGFQEPCSFCLGWKTSRSDHLVREYQHPQDRRTYQISGKTMDWAGRPAYIEYITDVSRQKRLEDELTRANEKMQDIINAIPGGVAIYKVSDIFETVYFSDGVPELSGYTVEEYKELIKGDAAELTYPEDTEMVVEKVRSAIENQTVADFEFRKIHKDGHIVWVHIQAKQIGEEDGCPLFHCVFHNISDLKETQLEMDHLVNSIPGGIASFRVEGKRFVPIFFSDGAMALSGHTREEFEGICRNDMLDCVYELDKERVLAAALAALESGEVLDISYRMRHKDGSLIWVHFNGRRIGPLPVARFYATFTGMSPEARLFQSIANETADGIYVIDRRNFDLLYANESKSIFSPAPNCLGQKCYSALRGKSVPCEFCTLGSDQSEGEERETAADGTERVFSTYFRETDWNGIPAYVKYVRDITQEESTRKEKERLEVYFQTLVENLPGGITVVCCQPGGAMTPEFISGGFAAMTHMTVEEAGKLYEKDMFAGCHPDDVEHNRRKLQEYMKKADGHCSLTMRLKRGDGSYIWVKNTLSLLQTMDGVCRFYSVYTDITRTMEEKERIRRQYEDIILQHYRTPSPNDLILGHCNITRDRILEIIDHTDSALLKTFGSSRNDFFTGIAGLVVDEKERQDFLNTYLNAPALAAFKRNDTEQILRCFVKLPKEERGRYVQFKVNLVETPDTGDITGILTVTDITEQTISDRILHQLSVTSYDYVIDLDLNQDLFTVMTCNRNATCAPPPRGRHSSRVADMAELYIAPKDRERYVKALEPDEIRRRLGKEGTYTFSYSVMLEKGDIRAKNMTVSEVDLRLGRVCLVCTDITDSVREEQGLLNMMAYTFELMGFLHVGCGSFTMYTRETVLENLPPYSIENYNDKVYNFADLYGSRDEDSEEVYRQFQMDTMLNRLSEKPSGYDFVFPYRGEDGLRYKQTNVLWGDENHTTICLVRADVTDMMAAERQSKEALEKALVLAEKANQAKSDFLSAMSHDIRTPMNAIMGMTTLAKAHLDEKDRVADCLQKISISSRHLLSLINDILDMSKIEQSKINLNRSVLSLSELLEELSAMMGSQAADAGLKFKISAKNITQEHFYGDSLRINQIFINILSNGVKFTPEGGSLEFLAEEAPSLRGKGYVRYRFTIRDTGIGMPEEFLSQIFAPFARSRAAAHIEGTGLGLSITKGLVDLMGGRITVESAVGKGSVFRVELELEAAANSEELQKESLPIPSGGEKDELLLKGRVFLVAEDNALNAEILSGLLALYGAETEIRADGRSAVRAFADAAPDTYDAILMDVQMPEMNGYEATRAIRGLNRPDALRIPIIAMTANAFSEDIQESLDAGMNAHVAKPIDVEVLRETLKKALGV